MDYRKIVLDGYSDRNNRKYLPEYFVREQKKASKDYYSIEEFFSGCESIIEEFSNIIKDQFHKEKRNCYFAIDHLNAGTMQFGDNDNSMTYEEKKEQSLNFWKEQLAGLQLDNFCVNLNHFNFGYSGHILNSDIEYISNAIKKAKKMIYENQNDLIPKINSNKDGFVESILKGMKELQTQGENAECIKNVKTDKKKLEAPFRNWFKTFFSSKFEIVNAEPEKGNGRIDLKIEDSSIGTKIIEFKGWWNFDKKEIVNQIISYMTDFETDGYVIIINNTRKKIENDYFELIKSESVRYLENSFQEIILQNSDFRYFISTHKDDLKAKRIYHFIFNIF